MKKEERQRVESSSPFVLIPRSNTEDMVDNTYKIHLNEEVLELSNEFSKYYYATDNDTQEDVFAIVFEEKFLPQIKAIEFLSQNPIDGLNDVLSYSIVKLSSLKQERLVAIVSSYDIEDNLASYLEHTGPISAQQLENTVGKISSVLSNLADAGIFGCSVNPSNILMKDGEFFALREFIDAYPNFYQENQYLAPELAECHKAGRLVLNNKSDVYALGVSMIEAHLGKAHWNDHKDIKDYNFARFENTTYKYLLSRIKLPEKQRVFFKYTLHDEAAVRWKASQMHDWLNDNIGKMPHDSLTEVKNTIGFNDSNYSNKKSISYALFTYWNEAIKFIKDNKLFKWASREQFSDNDLDQIQSIVDTKGDTPFVVANTLNSHIKISKLLSILDPDGPIRQENFAISAASMPQFLHYATVSKQKILADNVVKLMKDLAWADYHSHEYASGHLNSQLADIIGDLAAHTHAGSSAKGTERLIYSLNPNLTCTSLLLKGRYVNTIPELLVSLDSVAEKSVAKFTVDKNIVAFISAKLDLKDEIKAAILPNFPKLSEHPVIRGLSVLNVLQQHEPDIKIPNICKMVSHDLKELLEDSLHNVEFKKKIISKVEEVAKEGSLESVINILSDQQQFINDYNGYYEACRQAKILEQKIKNMTNKNTMFNGSLLIGQKITVLASYVLCFIVTVAVIM